MNIELRSEYPLTDEACREATGKTFAEWSNELSAKPEFVGKRREATNWLWDQTGRNTAGVWWGTTIWVEHEKRTGKTMKDGRPEGYGICATKTISAPVEAVLGALATKVGEVTRIREGKDIRSKWQTPNVAGATDVEVLFAVTGAKTGVTLNHKRIQTREEADGLRRHWSAVLDSLKKELES